MQPIRTSHRNAGPLLVWSKQIPPYTPCIKRAILRQNGGQIGLLPSASGYLPFTGRRSITLSLANLFLRRSYVPGSGCRIAAEARWQAFWSADSRPRSVLSSSPNNAVREQQQIGHAGLQTGLFQLGGDDGMARPNGAPLQMLGDGNLYRRFRRRDDVSARTAHRSFDLLPVAGEREHVGLIIALDGRHPSGALGLPTPPFARRPGVAVGRRVPPLHLPPPLEIRPHGLPAQAGAVQDRGISPTQRSRP